jgi:uncharacterized protein YggU (UPF0235/DUF167 family)
VLALADALDISRSSIEIVKGATSRTKIVSIKGVSRERIQLLASRG